MPRRIAVGHNCKKAPISCSPVVLVPTENSMHLDVNAGEYEIPIFYCPYCGKRAYNILLKECNMTPAGR